MPVVATQYLVAEHGFDGTRQVAVRDAEFTLGTVAGQV
jgi:hypothetical protein